jgi:SAM-dependent methyltransferase
MGNNLADRGFWKEYWEKAFLEYTIPENYRFHEILKNEFDKKNISNFLEIGGFPGNYSIFVLKYLHVKPTLLDFYIDEDVLNKFTTYNGIDKQNIDLIEHDLFTYNPEKKFDFVFSAGFIEHFENVENVISKHISLVNNGGTLMMTIPNLRGAIGLAHFIWHRNNLKHHNLKIMKHKNIRKELQKLNIEKYTIEYYGGFGMWLDNYDTKSKV